MVKPTRSPVRKGVCVCVCVCVLVGDLAKLSIIRCLQHTDSIIDAAYQVLKLD